MSKKRTKTNHKPAQSRPRWLLPALVGGGVLALVSIMLMMLANRQPAYTPQVEGAPRAEIDQTEIAHGDVRFETPVESIFRVRNIGSESLHILNEPWVETIEGC